jgi:hypothetical protein
MPAKPTLYNTITDATRAGVSVQRHRISREDAQKIRNAEKKNGHDAALRLVVDILYKRPTT